MSKGLWVIVVLFLIVAIVAVGLYAYNTLYPAHYYWNPLFDNWSFGR